MGIVTSPWFDILKIITTGCQPIKTICVSNKQWQLYLQPAGPDSLKRMDDEHAEMRLHYRLNDFDVAFGFNP